MRTALVLAASLFVMLYQNPILLNTYTEKLK